MDPIQEVLAFSREFVNGNQTEQRKRQIEAAYKQLTGTNLRINCRTCYLEAIFEIKRIMERPACNYRLQPGAVLVAFGDASKTCTNKNLTNALAEYHLKTNPGCIKWFSLYPADMPWIPKPAEELEIVSAQVEVKSEIQSDNKPVETVVKVTEKKATRAKRKK